MEHNLIDIYIGKKIRIRRRELGMNQTDLGKKIGITFQQIQKYEKGSNKIVASKLFDLSKIMDVPISYFFKNNYKLTDSLANQTEDDIENNQSSFLSELNESQAKFLYNENNNSLEEDNPARENITLIKLYNSLPNKNVRKKLLLFLKSLISEKNI